MLNEHLFWIVKSYCILYKMGFSLNITRHLQTFAKRSLHFYFADV